MFFLISHGTTKSFMSMTFDIIVMSNNNQSYYKYSVRDLKDLFWERGTGGIWTGIRIWQPVDLPPRSKLYSFHSKPWLKLVLPKAIFAPLANYRKRTETWIVHFAREHLKVPVLFVGFKGAFSQADLFQKTILFSVKVLFLSNKIYYIL